MPVLGEPRSVGWCDQRVEWQTCTPEQTHYQSDYMDSAAVVAQRPASMSELFAVFDSDGRHIGVAPRALVHRQGLWHRAANVFLFRSDGYLLLQRRQDDKDVCPGAWDLSVAEHVQFAESFAAAAARGLCEELGIEQLGLESLGVVVAARLDVPGSGIRDYEFQQSFRTVFDGAISPSADEVAETRFVTIQQLAGEVDRQPGAFTPWFLDRAREQGILPPAAASV